MRTPRRPHALKNYFEVLQNEDTTTRLLQRENEFVSRSYQGISPPVRLHRSHDTGEMPPSHDADYPPLTAHRPAPLQGPRQVKISLVD